MLAGLDLIVLDNGSTSVAVRFERPFAGAGAPPDPYHLVPGSFRSQLASDVAQWDQALSAARKLGVLPDNWDGYGALRVTSAVVDNTVQALETMSASNPLIPIPEVTPTPSGTISLTWESTEVDAVLEFGMTRYSGYVQVRHQPVVYLQGDSTKFLYEDCAVLASAINNALIPTANRLYFRRFPFDDRLAA